MDNNLTLTVENFEGRLNLSGFTNIEKGYTSKEFNQTFSSNKFRVFEESNVKEFINNINKAVGGEITKGGFNDTPEMTALIEKAKNDLGGLSKIRINDGPGTIRNVYVQEVVDEVTKSEDGDIEKSEKEDLEKSHIESAFSYGSNSFKFKKKGTEIKAKIGEVKTEIVAENVVLEKEIEDCMEDFISQPTEKPYTYGARERVKNPYKVFNWNQTYFNSGDNRMGATTCEGSEGEDCQSCSSQEEASNNQKYNGNVNKWIDNCAEICTLEMYEDNIEDNTNYELTPDQMLALKF